MVHICVVRYYRHIRRRTDRPDMFSVPILRTFARNNNVLFICCYWRPTRFPFRLFVCLIVCLFFCFFVCFFQFFYCFLCLIVSFVCFLCFFVFLFVCFFLCFFLSFFLCLFVCYTNERDSELTFSSWIFQELIRPVDEMEPGGGRGVERLPSLEQELALAGEGAEARKALIHILYHSQFQHNISVRIRDILVRLRIRPRRGGGRGQAGAQLHSLSFTVWT